mmetsp:Transcript_8927/g.19988  ORF Transcript_8927/g.19988 Transcript_8927/m.19988 type:complete len:80 (-) Transcript_8927:438-677(-)
MQQMRAMEGVLHDVIGSKGSHNHSQPIIQQLQEQNLALEARITAIGEWIRTGTELVKAPSYPDLSHLRDPSQDSGRRRR